MSILAFSNIGQAFVNGDVHYQYVTKTLTPTPVTAGYFVDMNQSSGQPVYNAFAGTQASFTPLEGGGNRGVYVGNFSTGKSKYLQRFQAVNVNTSANTTSPDLVYLNDYLGFYPLIDCDDLDSQVMDNTTSLTRYTDGDGVRIVFIVQAPILGTASCTVVYTNSEGVTGRSVTFNIIAGANIGVCATGTGIAGGVGEPTPFLPLADGDKGVRAIESIQFAASAGGFICAALVKPLTQIQLYEAGVPVEKNFGFETLKLPEIQEGAYLNFLIQRSGTGAGSLRAEMIFLNI